MTVNKIVGACLVIKSIVRVELLEIWKAHCTANIEQVIVMFYNSCRFNYHDFRNGSKSQRHEIFVNAVKYIPLRPALIIRMWAIEE